MERGREERRKEEGQKGIGGGMEKSKDGRKKEEVVKFCSYETNRN